MSSNIWTRCAGEREVRPLACSVLRAVEAQHVIATRKLVDSPAEQEWLEALIDSAKPPWPRGMDRAGLHYLLATPFRYPPLRHGSRFGSRGQPGIWYGSRRRHTALAEVAYYRLLFLEGSAAKIDRLEMELSTFRIRVESSRGGGSGRSRLCRLPRRDRLAHFVGRDPGPGAGHA
ncbi:MAG: RES family NAD+ phosphorylase [Acidobacteriota bacterium]|nr:RES family NAD+ phosphorylase [Acidobacteriota bacterium]